MEELAPASTLAAQSKLIAARRAGTRLATARVVRRPAPEKADTSTIGCGYGFAKFIVDAEAAVAWSGDPLRAVIQLQSLYASRKASVSTVQIFNDRNSKGAGSNGALARGCAEETAGPRLVQQSGGQSVCGRWRAPRSLPAEYHK